MMKMFGLVTLFALAFSANAEIKVSSNHVLLSYGGVSEITITYTNPRWRDPNGVVYWSSALKGDSSITPIGGIGDTGIDGIKSRETENTVSVEEANGTNNLITVPAKNMQHSSKETDHSHKTTLFTSDKGVTDIRLRDGTTKPLEDTTSAIGYTPKHLDAKGKLLIEGDIALEKENNTSALELVTGASYTTSEEEDANSKLTDTVNQLSANANKAFVKVEHLLPENETLLSQVGYTEPVEGNTGENKPDKKLTDAVNEFLSVNAGKLHEAEKNTLPEEDEEEGNKRLNDDINQLIVNANINAVKAENVLLAEKLLLAKNIILAEGKTKPTESIDHQDKTPGTDLVHRSKRGIPIVAEDDTSLESDNSLEAQMITLILNRPNALSLSHSVLEINQSLPIQSWQITLYGDNPSNVILLIQLHPDDLNVNEIVVHVDIERNHVWSVASNIIGWIYFVGWGLSAHCQVYVNWKRKSVIGLNFDYLGLNMIGHSLYGVYNMLLYFSHPVQEEYFRRHPFSANPIQINDVVFSAHNSLVTLYTVYQCFMYERGGQKLSLSAIFIYTVYGVWIFQSGLLAVLHRVDWLDFINQCALVKLTITLIKYMPQAYMNYKRKSTTGWSIGNVLLDFIGGLFSFLQMIILAYNFDDWHSLITDTTKLGLAVFTLVFDLLFIVQHYILYTDHKEVYKLKDIENGISSKKLEKPEPATICR
uniref:Cystinosin homolog n=1 Tax=Cacopsylla melanoneura TaxID=428564 RepID=A0A8D9BQF6_9HEMI